MDFNLRSLTSFFLFSQLTHFSAFNIYTLYFSSRGWFFPVTQQEEEEKSRNPIQTDKYLFFFMALAIFLGDDFCLLLFFLSTPKQE